MDREDTMGKSKSLRPTRITGKQRAARKVNIEKARRSKKKVTIQQAAKSLAKRGVSLVTGKQISEKGLLVTGSLRRKLVSLFG